MAKLPEGTAAAFNQWMRNYINDPDGYKQAWTSIQEFLNTPGGDEPNYGQSCAALLERLLVAQETSEDGPPVADLGPQAENQEEN